MDLGFSAFLKTVMASLVYSVLGIAVFALCFLVIKVVTPFSIRKEIEEDHNTALAIVIGAVILGISLIISAAIHG
jgi:putative membrane protein